MGPPDQSPFRKLPGVRVMVRSAVVVAAVVLAVVAVLTPHLGNVWSLALLTALPVFLVLGIGSQGFRFLRWHVLVTRCVPKLRIADSMRIYITGFALELTPGRLGAFLKFSLLRQTTGIPEADTVAVLPVEAAAEVASFLLVALVGAAAGSYALPRIGWGILATLVILLAIVVLSPSRHRLPDWRGPTWLLDHVPALRSMLRGLLQVGGPLPVAAALGCALAARGCEVVLFSTAAHSVGLTLSPAGTLLAWGTSGLAGGISLLPGGVGAAEGAVVATVVSLGGQAPLALAAALVTRVMTLWLWIPVGLVCALVSTRPRAADSTAGAD
ncbi:MAG TPA: lysylphosphatidylglycerol synthase transmembrane domain-containing protein [Chloroflexota bacterium]